MVITWYELPTEKNTLESAMTSIVRSQASGISNAVLASQVGAKLDLFKTAQKTWLNAFDVDLAALPKKTLKAMATHVWNMIINSTPDMLDAWKAGIGLDVGTAFMGLEESYSGFPQLLGMYKTIQVNVAARRRLERYWNTVYYPAVPDVKLAFEMVMHGQLSRGEFDVITTEEGWETKWADKLFEVLTTNPDIFNAFSMFKRGLIDVDELKGLFRINGYDAAWDDTLLLALQRIPTLREITTLADFVTLPDLWVGEKLRQQGYQETDVPYMVSAIGRRPIREETRNVTYQLSLERGQGFIDATTFAAGLDALRVLPAEKDLLIIWAEARYQDTLIFDSIDVIEEKAYSGYYDDFVDPLAEMVLDLQAAGIQLERANLLAEKFYFHYIYVAP
jgi:hypothetical protein